MHEEAERLRFEAFVGGCLDRADDGAYRIRRIENDWQLWLEASRNRLIAENGYLEFLDRQNNQLRAAIFAIMRRLTELLDEDHFAEIDGLALEAGIQPPAVPACPKPHIDGCTESNCNRCRTHPDRRGAMEHAGIGWRPGDDNA